MKDGDTIGAARGGGVLTAVIDLEGGERSCTLVYPMATAPKLCTFWTQERGKNCRKPARRARILIDGIEMAVNPHALLFWNDGTTEAREAEYRCADCPEFEPCTKGFSVQLTLE